MRVRQIAGAATFTVGLVLLIPALAMGRVYVGDSNAGGDAAPCPNGHCGAIFAVPSAGGDGVVLAAGTSGGVLQHPSGLVPASDKALFAGDFGSDSIVRVNRETGAVNTFVSGPKLADLVELGRTHDALYYTTVSGNLFRVDLDDKSVRKVNSELLVSPQGVAVSGGHAYVSNSHSDIYKVNLSTGHVGYLVKESPKWNYGGELKLSPNHELLYLPASSPGILKIRISDGHVHKIADVAGTPLSIARRGGGGFLVGNNYFGDVEQVAKNGTVAAFSETPLFQYPTAGLVIGP